MFDLGGGGFSYYEKILLFLERNVDIRIEKENCMGSPSFSIISFCEIFQLCIKICKKMSKSY